MVVGLMSSVSDGVVVAEVVVVAVVIIVVVLSGLI